MPTPAGVSALIVKRLGNCKLTTTPRSVPRRDAGFRASARPARFGSSASSASTPAFALPFGRAPLPCGNHRVQRHALKLSSRRRRSSSRRVVQLLVPRSSSASRCRFSSSRRRTSIASRSARLSAISVSVTRRSSFESNATHAFLIGQIFRGLS